jgi:hypothetical protein
MIPTFSGDTLPSSSEFNATTKLHGFSTSHQVAATAGKKKN